ncbi:hypothetical protein BJV82DRAFT_55655 [Fennellomyces sp. T-0311]|nr:hypothetical protein BJV82DRAFT_55655 [Fennellomyces sp. T-0311]
MFLENICPGQVNPQPHAIESFVWKSIRYIIYATGSKVVIYADPAKLVQIISAATSPNDDKQQVVTAVAGCPRTGRLALSYETYISIYQYTDAKDLHQWHLDTVIDAKTRVNCLDWSKDGHLLAAGEEISIWVPVDKEGVHPLAWKNLWHIKPATDVVIAKFEPNSILFATVGSVSDV